MSSPWAPQREGFIPTAPQKSREHPLSTPKSIDVPWVPWKAGCIPWAPQKSCEHPLGTPKSSHIPWAPQKVGEEPLGTPKIVWASPGHPKKCMSIPWVPRRAGTSPWHPKKRGTSLGHPKKWVKSPWGHQKSCEHPQSTPKSGVHPHGPPPKAITGHMAADTLGIGVHSPGKFGVQGGGGTQRHPPHPHHREKGGDIGVLTGMGGVSCHFRGRAFGCGVTPPTWDPQHPPIFLGGHHAGELRERDFLG